jgi:hypothetical protein
MQGSSIVRVRHCESRSEVENLNHIRKDPRASRALQALRKHSRVLRHRRVPGANPVASALDNLAGRDHSETMRTHRVQIVAPKIGTLYLAGKELSISSTSPYRPSQWSFSMYFMAVFKTRK